MFKRFWCPWMARTWRRKILPQVETLAKQTHAAVTLLTVGSSDICAGGGAPVEPVKEGASCPSFPSRHIWSKLRQASGPGRGSDLGL